MLSFISTHRHVFINNIDLFYAISWLRLMMMCLLLCYFISISNIAFYVNSKNQMDSFGAWQKWKWIFFLVNAEFYRVVWTKNALLVQFAPKCFHFQKITITITSKCSESPQTLCHKLHCDNLPLGNIALQDVIQNNCRNRGRSDGVSGDFLYFPKFKK